MHNKVKLVGLTDIIESNGKTIGENNANVTHKYPIGTLVEVKFARWHGDGACEKIHARLFVVKHTRDCDQTPMYTLSSVALSNWPHRSKYWLLYENLAFDMPPFTPPVYGGFLEESLTPVEITDAVRRGEGNLTWKDDE